MSITAILLAAGYGTRLYPLTRHTPKALLPLGDGVILDVLMEALDAVSDVTQRVLVTNTRFVEQFRSWKKARQRDVKIIDDGTQTPETRLGAVRDLELARTHAHVGRDWLVIGTDNLFRWSLGAFVRKAQTQVPSASVALWEAPLSVDTTPFGVVTLDPSSRITALVEKSAQPPSRRVALCIYYFPHAMGDKITPFLHEGGNADATGYLIAYLAQTGLIYGITMSGDWYDIGSREAYDQVVALWGRTTSAKRKHPAKN